MTEAPSDKVSTRFLSTAREHIVRVMTGLAKSLPSDVLQDPEKPLIVSVRGARCIGKSLIPFVFRDALFGAQPQMQGLKEYDERWTGSGPDGKQLEIGFVNLVWPFSDVSREMQEHYPAGVRQPTKQQMVEAFLSQREHGGMTFISFAEMAEDVSPGLTIEMVRESLPKHLPQEKRLAEAFFDAICDHSRSDWLRITKIKVSDPRLLQSGKFMQAVSDIRPVYKEAVMLDRRQKPQSAPRP